MMIAGDPEDSPPAHRPDDESQLVDNSQQSERREIRVALPTVKGLRKALTHPRAFAVLAIVLAFASVAYVRSIKRTLRRFVEVQIALDTNRDSLATAETELDKLSRQYEIWQAIVAYSPIIDLRSGGLQDIGEGFTAGDLTVTDIPGGARVGGIIINAQAVGHKGAEFRINTLGQSRTFSVMSLPSGG
ncbi:MAG: hypothetical protein CVU53_06525, partial [Deltaproteobacteria bacterium HGW-Deltaproteobacteria-11]